MKFSYERSYGLALITECDKIRLFWIILSLMNVLCKVVDVCSVVSDSERHGVHRLKQTVDEEYFWRDVSRVIYFNITFQRWFFRLILNQTRFLDVVVGDARSRMINLEILLMQIMTFKQIHTKHDDAVTLTQWQLELTVKSFGTIYRDYSMLVTPGVRQHNKLLKDLNWWSVMHLAVTWPFR